VLPGKVPPDVLQRIIFSKLGKGENDVILGPGIGQDASVLRVGEKIIIASTDPITGSIEDIGWLAVHINANDIATFGVQPKWFLTSIMLPKGTTESHLERIMKQINDAATSLDISLVGGHTEITESLSQPIIAGFMIGVCEEGEYVTSKGAQPNDSIIMTKSIAIEGTAIIAAEGSDYFKNRITESKLNDALNLRNMISVVAEGVVAVETGHVTAMHDPTEGGLSNGIHEIADASEVGFIIDHDKIPIEPISNEICEIVGINVLELISSGCMLITCNSEYEHKVLRAIESTNTKATVIGSIVDDPSIRIIRDSSGERNLERPRTDALWAALKNIKTA
jgi:hydrogenase expression/formation protein HypE